MLYMKKFSPYFILMLFAVLCNGAENSNTLELPRKNISAHSFKADETDVAGQKRYRILTDHYDITAFRLTEGKLAGERLEHLAQAWKLLATEYMKESVNELPQHRHKVIVYRDKQEYTLHLFRIEPSIARTNGFYFSPRKTAYFFSPLEAKVLFHEGTHQIFEEHFFRESTPVFRNNFWVVEGIALFMETLKIDDKSYKIGDIFADRLYSAKVYRLERKHVLPIEKLTAMSAWEIQQRADLQEIYSQSATLVHWLMFADAGRYRDSLFELLRRTYLGSSSAETLRELSGLSFEELDARYAEFLQAIPED